VAPVVRPFTLPPVRPPTEPDGKCPTTAKNNGYGYFTVDLNQNNGTFPLTYNMGNGGALLIKYRGKDLLPTTSDGLV